MGVSVIFTLAIMNNVTMKISVQVFVWTYFFICLGYIRSIRIAESCGKSVQFFEEAPRCFPQQLTISYSQQQCMKDRSGVKDRF